MKIPFLDLGRMEASLKHRLKERFSDLLDAGIFSGGKEVEALENSVCDFLKSSFSIPCANGTDALELALRALGIGPGDEVIVPAMTWVSTAEAVVMVGAKPVFWDTDEEGLLRKDWEKAVVSKSKAVIPVHLYGKMVEMADLTVKAKSLGLFVIEDAAQAYGSFQNGRAAGTWGDVGCLSFYPTKNLGALGEAGMCLTQDEFLAEKLRLLLNHGQPLRDQHELVGRNSRIDTIQAAFLNVMLEDFEANQQKRKTIAKRYLDAFSGIEELGLPSGILDSDHNAHLFVIQTEKRNELRDFLVKKGVGTAIHYPVILPEMKPFAIVGDFENARNLANIGLSLPLNPYLRSVEVDVIIECILAFFRK
ncbi:DegT/DnrJ/EryC1/StrS aminotransferase family protein [Algoriphagus sp.]|uniref:DegT/DnrJ/EryC1/StrS family aminotransferase n=1 Tax=Algoriphagus sp. TaxID=1872435 RepID=UPI00271BD8EB|nr:DegT/DnrJ/EryC1/StrS family aminotransferase [Algoriphagus sp.]MDO8968742.1 DegT/DnrJ/EryC1/StrS family aminotransferase [Algoriphagus sp.]MDP3199340.1 DegT/DnrJ/EryC1/StrS family aminotransferase [Algoriphagus sp.]